MAKKYPVKVMLDANREPFMPFVTMDSIVVDEAEGTLASLIYDRYTKEETDNLDTAVLTAANLYTDNAIASYSIPIASAGVLGAIKVGTNLSITEDGVLSAVDETYTPTPATATELGCIKVGDNLSIAPDGTLSPQGLEPTSNKKITLDTADNVGFPTTQAVKDYVDTQINTRIGEILGGSY